MLPRRVSIPNSLHQLRFAVVVLACAVGFASGCRSIGGGGKSKDATPVGRNTDPLLGGGRIPPQNLPIPGRDAYGARERRDPLLGSPTGGRLSEPTERTDRTSTPPEEKAAKAGDPYRPNKTTTNAALAARMPTDDSTLSIDARPEARPAGRGPVPLKPSDDATATGGWTFDQIVTELKRYGAACGTPERDAEGYVVRADVPLDADKTRFRRYEGGGTTPALAAKQVLDQVRADSGGK